MPKKRHAQALRIKPGDASNSGQPERTRTRPSVNELIHESRRLQLRKGGSGGGGVDASVLTTGSVPPQVRQVLNLPEAGGGAPLPALRPGSVIPGAPPPPHGSNGGVRRVRRIPGPPPPRSWLMAAAGQRVGYDNDDDDDDDDDTNKAGGDNHHRRWTARADLPGLSLPPRPGSLQDLALKGLATRWSWHAEYYGEWLAEELPTKTREALLSYIAVYNNSPPQPMVNPLRLLFTADLDEDSRSAVKRLDLTGGIGVWTTLRQLHRDLGPVEAMVEDERNAAVEVPDDWDEGHQTGPQPGRVLTGPMFKNLQHLSLALSPGQTSGPSWKDLIQLAGKVSTITSLSLAFWPLPTYTPRAASSRVVIPSATPRPQVLYGGTNMYSPFDDDWRESAGILRSLSRALYCLKWLDLTGCAGWFPALTWTAEEGGDYVFPDWNGWWRGVQHIRLAVGWEPIEPQPQFEEEDDQEFERRKYAHQKVRREHETLAGTAKTVAEQIKWIRRMESGKWIEFEF